MQAIKWLNQAESTMLRAGLPRDYVVRTCSELNDHLQECQDDETSPALLNESPRELATSIVHSYRSSGIFRRIPPVLLLLLPLPITIALTLGYFAACYLALDFAFDCFDGNGALPLHVTATIWSLFYAGKVAGPLLSGLVAREIARRMARPWYWAAILFVLQCIAIAVTRPELIIASEGSSLSIHCGSEQLLYASQFSIAGLLGLLGWYFVARERLRQLGAIA